MKINSTVLMVGLAILVLGAVITAGVIKKNAPGEYDRLTQCITDQGGKIYEAYWCSACAQQDELLGSSHRLLNRVECTSPGGVNKENPFELCPDITGTPTWEKADGTRETGVKTPEQLAKFFGCAIQ